MQDCDALCMAKVSTVHELPFFWMLLFPLSLSIRFFYSSYLYLSVSSLAGLALAEFEEVGDAKLNDLENFLKTRSDKYLVDCHYSDFFGYVGVFVTTPKIPMNISGKNETKALHRI